LYMSRIVCLHGVPKKIVSDRGTQFTSRFWEKLHESMDTKLNFSSASALKHGVDGIRVCGMLSSLTTTAIKLV
jgi:hypothetical protein